MTQQPFSRPGAIDLSALRRPPATQRPSDPSHGGAGAPEAAARTTGAAASAYSVLVDEQNFQGILESSMTAPVLLVFFSRTRMPETGQLADDMETLADEFAGRFLVGLVDVELVPAIAQAMQIPSVPLVIAVVDGRPMPLFQEAAPIDQVRDALTQVGQQLTVQGITGRHQPRQVEAVGEDGTGEDPRFAAATAALNAGDVDGAVAEYQKLALANPADVEAGLGLARAKVIQRTYGVDLQAARAAAAADPDDMDAQILVADLDVLGGHVEDAFGRLTELVRRTDGADRARAREHLLELFAAVGPEDPRVLRGRQNLASALF